MMSRKLWMLVPPAALALTVGTTASLWLLPTAGSAQRARAVAAEAESDAAMDRPTAASLGALTGAAATGPVSLIVDYRDDVTDAELAATPEDERPISRWSSADRVYRVTYPSVAEAAQAWARLDHDPRIESVDVDEQATLPLGESFDEAASSNDKSMQAECAPKNASGHGAGAARADGVGDGAFPSDPCYRYQWHLRQIGLPEAWKLGRGEGAVVAVIDTGVSRVPDLAQTRFVPGYNFIDDNDDARDDHGHGTHVAGTIAQSTNNGLGVGGVAFGAAIMPLKVLSARGSGSMAAIAQAIRFAADHGANVINMSLGGPFPVATIARAVKYAREKGVTVVAAAGNDGRGRVSYPGRDPGVIGVAATQFDESTTFYSNWGPQIDIAAPGGNVRVDQNGDGKPDGVLQNTVVPGNVSQTDYLWFMGTSMAAPHVAGVAALIVGAGVTRPDAVEKILLESARAPKKVGYGGDATGVDRRIQDGGRDPHYGAGVVDANAALTGLHERRGISELGLGTSLALLGFGWMSRRGFRKVGLGFVAALVVGASGWFAIPGLGVISGLAGMDVLTAVDAHVPAAMQHNPLLWSALLPVAAVAFFYGVRRLRGTLAGLSFGIAGALLFTAIAMPHALAWVPSLLARPWLLGNAALATLLGAALLRRD